MMKHIKLFENFDVPQGDGSSIVFDWMPFDDQINNPINSSIPESLNLREAIEFCQSRPEIGEAGLFIAHNKMSNGGFIRYVIKSTEPLLMDTAVFDSNFKKISEHNDIDPTKMDVDSYSKGASALGSFGLFGNKD